jgi:diguanylate cyclase (GGDEF)-like protein
MMTGGIICAVMALMLSFQAVNLQAYRRILITLIACLISGSTAMILAVADSGINDPARGITANIAGTAAYVAAMACLIDLYKPQVRRDIPWILVAISFLGCLVFSDIRTSYIWSQFCRIVLMVYTTWLISSSRDAEAPGLRYFALSMPILSILGMTPQLFALMSLPVDATIKLIDPSSDASLSQAMLWAISPSVVYACVTSVIHTRIARRLRNSANFDLLTGARSRRYFIEKGGKILEERQARLPDGAASLLLIDVDYFKKVNDTWGHMVGDAVLKHCVTCIQDVIRSDDSIVCRYGGEEFCVLLPKTSLSGASIAAERVRAHIASTPFAYGEELIPLTVSIGVVLQESDATMKSLISVADHRLYRAKQSGRNLVVDFGEPGLAPA